MKHETSRLRANKALGQHFLHDQSAIARIIQAIPEDVTALEIGPGKGAITHGLLKRVRQLSLIEKDDRFAALWQQQAKAGQPLRLWHGDVMQCLDAACERDQPSWIVGNLPYNISGPLTARLSSLSLPGGMVLMYQREVGERIMAAPGSRIYGSLSVLVRHYYNVQRLLTLPPGAFSPPPKVHSVVLRLMAHHRSPSCDWQALQACVRQGFAHRRKTLANNFRGTITPETMRLAGINPTQRPEQLAYEGWCQLALYMP